VIGGEAMAVLLRGFRPVSAQDRRRCGCLVDDGVGYSTSAGGGSDMYLSLRQARVRPTS
jgi:hypothetical protein